MSRRTTLPGADELFRSTGSGRSGGAADDGAGPAPAGREMRPASVDDTGSAALGARAQPDVELGPGPEDGARTVTRRRPRPVADRKPSGRQRHDEKITVYISADELMDLEHARLNLRGEHGLAIDRGRIVREALAVVLADLDAKGESSILVRRLRGR